MQGGRGFSGLLPPDESSSGGESDLEVKVSEPLHLTKSLDDALHRARRALSLALAFPVALIYLTPSVETLIDDKLRSVKRGTDTVLAIQTYRMPVLDAVFQAITFMAEEEFYLVALPVLFWIADYQLGFRLTFVICTGLFVGNIVKDVFQLPRPASPPVWRPHHNLDSTALQDFGFPSTHAMNAVTNSLVVAWHYNRMHAPALMLCGLYVGLLSFSRLYLGAHTGTDIRGGLGLGALVFAAYASLDADIERGLAALSPVQVTVGGLVLGSILLLLVPQPRPPTPTFLQNALLVGLQWGLCAGSRAALPEWKTAPIEGGMPMALARAVAGFALVAVTRVVVKQLVSVLVVNVAGINTKPVVKVLQKRTRVKGKIRLLTRDKDLIGLAIIKTLVYFSLAVQITFGAPWLFSTLGL